VQYAPAASGELCRIIRHLGSGNQIDAAFVGAWADFVEVAFQPFGCIARVVVKKSCTIPRGTVQLDW